MSSSSGPQLSRNRAIHPGRLLADELEARCLSSDDLAQLVHPSTKHIDRVLRGRAGISRRFAADLEQVLGIPSPLWQRLQADYDETLTRLAAEPEMHHDIELLNEIPWREFVKQGWIEDRGTDVEQVGELRTHYGVDTLDAVRRDQLAVAFRITANTNVDPWALAAWLQQGEWQAIESRLTENSALALGFEPSLFAENLRRIRMLVGEASFWTETRSLCASAGVHLEYVPHIRNSGANGLTRWLDDGRPLIQVSLLRKRADIFWFSFFHEAAHVLKNDRNKLFIHGENLDRSSPAERAADEFAADLLIPRESWLAFIERGDFGGAAITEFADGVGIHPGIIVGRLQHEKKIPRNQHNDLRVSLDPSVFAASEGQDV